MIRIRNRRNTSVQWLALNPILLSGELGYELDTGRHKIGDGVSRWIDLDYFLPESDVQERIDLAVGEIVLEGGGVSQQQLDEHVNSPTPHTAYDSDGPSFLLLYENAKV